MGRGYVGRHKFLDTNRNAGRLRRIGRKPLLGHATIVKRSTNGFDNTISIDNAISQVNRNQRAPHDYESNFPSVSPPYFAPQNLHKLATRHKTHKLTKIEFIHCKKVE